MQFLLAIFPALLALASVGASPAKKSKSKDTKPERHRIPSWVGPFNFPVYVYKWDRGSFDTIHVYGMNYIKHPHGMFNATQAFGPGSHVWNRRFPDGYTFEPASLYGLDYKPIADPLLGKGYEWEVHFRNMVFMPIWIEVLAELELPFDWMFRTKVEGIGSDHGHSRSRPVFDMPERTTVQLGGPGCPSDLFLRTWPCRKHADRACNMPSGACRTSHLEMERWKWPRCSGCPIPMVEDFKWELNDKRLRKKLTLEKLDAIADKYGLSDGEVQALRDGQRSDSPLGKFHREHFRDWERAVREMQEARVRFEKKLKELPL